MRKDIISYSLLFHWPKTCDMKLFDLQTAFVESTSQFQMAKMVFPENMAKIPMTSQRRIRMSHSSALSALSQSQALQVIKFARNS